MTIVLPSPLAPLNDAESRQGGEYARRTGRSWWAVRYSWLDGWMHEWDAEPASPNKHRDWPLLPKRGRQAVRLYCPNGKLAQLGDTHDASGKLFQFKHGARSFRVMPTHAAFISQEVLAHVIGMVHGLNGECTLYAWELLPPPEIPSDAPNPPNKEEWIAKSAEPGLYEKAVAEWNIAIAEYENTPQYKAWAQRYVAWEGDTGGRLFGPIEDNVYDIKYRQIGRLNADVLGIDDGEGR